MSPNSRDIGWDPIKGMLEWAKYSRAEIHKYLIKCECLQCKSMERNFRWGWIEIDALWCIELRYRAGIKCPYCYHRLNESCSMVVEVEDCGPPSEDEVARLGLKESDFIGIKDPTCLETC